MKVLFMGTPEFSIPSLEKLYNSSHHIVGVITQPDRPKGRGYKVSSPPVKEKAEELGLSVWQPETINTKEFLQLLTELSPDVITTVSIAHYIPKNVWQYPRYGCINLHPSLLPKYRGTSPIVSAILNGDTETGVTTFYIDEGWDSGDIILQKKIRITNQDTRGSLTKKLALLGSEVLLETLDLLEKGCAPRIPQDHSLATYTRKVHPRDGLINWDFPSVIIERQIRAYNPTPSSFTYFRGKRIKVLKATVGNSLSTDAYPGGTIIKLERGKGFWVATGRGELLIEEVQPEGKRRMSAWEFHCGYKIKDGELLKSILKEKQ